MTFIGWNDSIRYDYNEDGQFTNNIDITGDGVVNMLDWEIGGLRLVNSHGDGWADSGFAYVMYRVIAQEKLDGGIWNKSVNVFDIKEYYEPLLTYNIDFKHGSRNKVKFDMGVSADTTDVWPQHTMDYPIFNFQGGDHYMQGFETNEDFKTIEAGLDATPLLSFINPEEPAKFFFQVQERDPYNEATGQINYFAVIDYLNGGLEIPTIQTNQPITENGITTTSVIHTLTFDKIHIVDDDLPAFTNGQTYSHQFTAIGGTEPYTWDIVTPYHEHIYTGDYPFIESEQLDPGGYSNEYVTKQLDFTFPFYGKMFDSVTMHIDGFIMFDQIAYPFPYQVDELLLFKYEPMIAPFLNQEIEIIEENGDGLWYEGNEDFAAFRWKVSLIKDDEEYPLDFTTKLFPDGTITFFFDEFENYNYLKKATGISNGDDMNYELSGFSDLFSSKSTKIISYTPGIFLVNSSINSDGLFTIDTENSDNIYDITIRATDYNNISSIKKYHLSDGIIFDYSISSGDDSQIDYGETTFLNFEIENIGELTQSNIDLSFELSDPHITMLDNVESFGSIEPGETILINDAISFEVSHNIPNNYDLSGFIVIESDEEYWEGKVNLRAFAPKLQLGNPIVLDDNNGRIDPGETADIVIPLNNTGASKAVGISGTIFSDEEYITFNSSTELAYNDISKNEAGYDTVNITVSQESPMGYLISFDVDMLALPSITLQDSFELLVGRYPALIVDMDPESASAPAIQSAMEEIGVIHSYSNYLPNNLDIYQNMFLSLGRKFHQHILTDYEGQVLANFLNTGGNIYMEGQLTWAEDPQTAVHPMFNVSTETVSWNFVNPVSGVDGTFTENMWFEYMGAMNYYDNYLIPEGSAFAILGKDDVSHNFMVAYDAEIYKTVGSTIDFGGLVDDIHPSTKKNLLAKILIFFGQDIVITEIDDKEIYRSPIRCFPNPFSSYATLQFTLTEESTVDLSIHDMNGTLIQQLYTEKELPPGTHEYIFEKSDLENGIYLCNFRTKATNYSIKLVIVR